MNHHIRTITVTALAAAASIAAPAAALADDAPVVECRTVDYQGAPLEMCPEREPDPTNCYTGDYQGAPIEVCMPTGDTLPPGTIDTATGEPPVIHVSKDYVAPVTTTPTPSAPAVVEPAPVADATPDLASIAAAAIAGIPRL